MKKFCVTILAVTALTSSVLASAETTKATGYFTAQTPKASFSMTTKSLMPPTDITITNASNNIIYVTVPNTSIHDLLSPTYNEHLRNNSYYGSTVVALEDPNHNVFWSGPACRLALITVYGSPSYYQVNIDNELCY